MSLRYKEILINGEVKTHIRHISSVGRKTSLGFFDMEEEFAKNIVDTVLYETNEGQGLTNKQRFEAYKKALRTEEARLRSFENNFAEY